MAHRADVVTAERPCLDLHLDRLFAAPRAVLFKLWIEPRHLIHWWGPRGFPTLSCAIDPKPGGAWRIHSGTPEGKPFSFYGVFHEILPPERLVLSHGFDFPGLPPDPSTIVALRFLEDGGKTRLVLHQSRFVTQAECDGHEEGWTSAFDLIDDYLPYLSRRKETP